MSPFETFLVAILVALIVLPFANSARRQSETFWVFAPSSMISLFFAVYFIVGPLSAIAFDDTLFLGRDMRPVFSYAWMAGVIGLLAIWSGYYSPAAKMILARSRREAIDEERFYKSGLIITAIGFVCVIVWVVFSGRVLEIFGAEIGSAPDVEFDEATRVAYFYHGMSLVFVGVFMQLAVKRLSVPLAICLLLPVSLIFVAIGFRYRMLFVLGGLTLILHFRRQRRPRYLMLLAIALAMFTAFGIIGMARQYYGGLDLSHLEGRTWEDLYLGTLGDTNTFYVLGAVIDIVPSSHDFVGLQPLLYALILPIPRFMWPSKPFPEYLYLITDAIGTDAAISAGSAWPFLGEHYAAFGWTGMVLMCIALGITCRFVWLKFRRYPNDPGLMVIYSLAFPFIYYVLSRGYLAQEVQDFCFTLLPAIVARRISTIRVRVDRSLSAQTMSD